MLSGSRKTLGDNIARLIEDHSGSGRRSLRAWALGIKLDVKIAQRAFSGETAATIDTLDEIAEHVGCKPWQLLYPGMDPRFLAQPTFMSPLAADLARMLDRVHDEDQKRKLHAVISQMIEFADVEEPEAPSPAPMHKQARSR